MTTYDLPSDDPVINQLHQLLIKKHEIPNHTITNLVEHKDIEGFTEETKHFVLLGNIPISYISHTQLNKKKLIGVNFKSVTLYDDLLEYEKERSIIYKQKDSHNPSQN